MVVSFRHRLELKLETLYLVNAIQSIPTYAHVGDVLSHDIRWCTMQPKKITFSNDNMMVCRVLYTIRQDHWCSLLGNFDEATLTMGANASFDVSKWFKVGKPVTVRVGRENNINGKIFTFSRRERDGNGGGDFARCNGRTRIQKYDDDWSSEVVVLVGYQADEGNGIGQ